MILVIRISGQVDLAPEVKETLYRLRLRKKFVAVLLEDTDHNRKLLRSVRNYIAYGTITSETLEMLLTARGQPVTKGKKIDAKKVASELGKKTLEETGVKPFFRLHPPRGGIDSKYHVGKGKGVLGDHKNEINKLLEKML